MEIWLVYLGWFLLNVKVWNDGGPPIVENCFCLFFSKNQKVVIGVYCIQVKKIVYVNDSRHKVIFIINRLLVYSNLFIIPNSIFTISLWTKSLTTITKVRGKIEKISCNQKLHNYNLERTDLQQALTNEVHTSFMLHLKH